MARRHVAGREMRAMGCICSKPQSIRNPSFKIWNPDLPHQQQFQFYITYIPTNKTLK